MMDRPKTTRVPQVALKKTGIRLLKPRRTAIDGPAFHRARLSILPTRIDQPRRTAGPSYGNRSLTVRLNLVYRGMLLAYVAFAGLVFHGLSSAARAEDAADAQKSAKTTAIALNYCRAAFHRIRKEPSKVVLMQEQEKILNNLNLQHVVDPEIIQLYTAVLDEIGQISMAEHERQLLHNSYAGNLQRKVAWDALAFSTDLATAQIGGAIKTGANSWWDYRGMVVQRDQEILKVDKTRLTAVVQKSSQFLDTFWKLAQRRNIPDRWLVRGDDLDALEQALREKDPNVRQRVLKRMEPYLSMYPPYWYYTARTAQEQGQLIVAASLYEQLRQLGDGYFRKDDMLATALANRAALQEQLADKNTAAEGPSDLKLPSSDPVATVKQALSYSTDAWEANLLCARILQRHKQYSDAEDAILRNLDVGLEKPQSRVYLASLYYHSEQRDKMVKMLNDPETIAQLPAPVLLRCSAWLGYRDTPLAVRRTVLQSMEGTPHFLIGPDEFVLKASPAWQLPLANVKLIHEGQELTPSNFTTLPDGKYQMRFVSKTDWGNPFHPPSKLKLSLRLVYPDQTNLQMTLQSPHGQDLGSGISPAKLAGTRISSAAFVITEVTVGEARVAVYLGPDPPERIDADNSPVGSATTKTAESPTAEKTDR